LSFVNEDLSIINKVEALIDKETPTYLVTILEQSLTTNELVFPFKDINRPKHIRASMFVSRVSWEI
jgi:hypothetical protein